MSRCFDLDGTLLNYGNADFTTFVNTAFLDTLAGTTDAPEFIKIVTNQGGLQFGMAGIAKYPTLSYFEDRIIRLMAALQERNVYIDRVYACIYHPKGDHILEDQVKEAIAASRIGRIVTVLDKEAYRKPAPGMLLLAGATVLYGDSDEDEQAAQAAGIPFIRVDRFHG